MQLCNQVAFLNTVCKKNVKPFGQVKGILAEESEKHFADRIE